MSIFCQWHQSFSSTPCYIVLPAGEMSFTVRVCWKQIVSAVLPTLTATSSQPGMWGSGPCPINIWARCFSAPPHQGTLPMLGGDCVLDRFKRGRYELAAPSIFACSDKGIVWILRMTTCFFFMFFTWDPNLKLIPNPLFFFYCTTLLFLLVHHKSQWLCSCQHPDVIGC